MDLTRSFVPFAGIILLIFASESSEVLDGSLTQIRLHNMLRKSFEAFPNQTPFKLMFLGFPCSTAILVGSPDKKNHG